jgi:HEAT repeat protein
MRWKIHSSLVIACLYWIPLAYAGAAAENTPISTDVPPEVLTLIRDLNASSSKKKITAIRRLGEMGPYAGAAAPYMIELLDSEQKYISPLDKMYNAISILGSSGFYVRDETKTALVRIGTPAVDPLIHALSHPRPKVRGNAALTLGKIHDSRAIPPLINALKDRDPEVRMWAAAALAEIPSRQAVKPLISALRDTEGNVRAYAAFALGQIGDHRAVEPLIEALRQGNTAASPALYEITGERFGDNAEKWQEWWDSNETTRNR